MMYYLNKNIEEFRLQFCVGVNPGNFGLAYINERKLPCVRKSHAALLADTFLMNIKTR